MGLAWPPHGLMRFQRGDWVLGNGNSASEPPIAHRQSLNLTWKCTKDASSLALVFRDTAAAAAQQRQVIDLQREAVAGQQIVLEAS
jgi:hypothetical protein